MKNNSLSHILVLMSVFNGEKYVDEQISSIMNQEGVQTILLIRDDGSKDSTKNIIRNNILKYSDRIFLREGENWGFALSFTELLKMAYIEYSNFSYFAFADQDDVWEPQKLYSAIQFLKCESDNLPITYCSNTKLVDSNLNFMRYAWKDSTVCLTKERALIQNFATGCTMVFNRKAVELYVTHLPREVKRHDFLMYQLCMFLGKVIYDHNSYIDYRQHGNNQIGRPNFLGRMKMRKKGHYKERILEYQNKYFLEAYKDLLSVEDVGLVSRFVFYRNNIFTRLSLLFDRKIKCKGLEANIFLIMKILLGRV